MKLHVLSDLHTEFANFDLPETDAGVIVLAGDIGVGTGGVDWIRKQRPDKPVIYVPGNHEFYGHDIALIEQLLSGAPPDVYVLDNQSWLSKTSDFSAACYGRTFSCSERPTSGSRSSGQSSA